MDNHNIINTISQTAISILKSNFKEMPIQ